MNFDKLMEFRNSCQGFIDLIGLKITNISEGYAEGEIEINETLLNPFGTVHGGCIFSLVDSVGGTAAMTRGNVMTTSSCNISYLNPATNNTIIKAIAKEVKNGGLLLVYDVEVYDGDEMLVAKATCTYVRLQKHDFL